MAGITNRGAARLLSWALQCAAPPGDGTLYLALLTAAQAPTDATDLLGDAGLVEVAAGNGYTAGGQSLPIGSTTFILLAEEDALHRSRLILVDVTWTAVGGPLPASGSGARYALLLTGEATPADRQVLAWWDLVSDRTVQSGQELRLSRLELRATQS